MRHMPPGAESLGVRRRAAWGGGGDNNITFYSEV
jgi:hypothetical protein